MPNPTPQEPIITIDKTPSPIDDLIDDAQAFEDKQTAAKETAEQKTAAQEQVISAPTNTAETDLSSDTAQSPGKENDSSKVEIKPAEPAPKPAAAKKIKKVSKNLPSPSVLKKSIDGEESAYARQGNISEQEEYGQTPQYPHSWTGFYFGIVYLAVLIFFIYFIAKRSQDFSDDKTRKN